MIVLAVVVVLLQAPVVPAPVNPRSADWVGSWKCADPEVYATLDITDVGAGGLALTWDENVGINGTHAEGRAAWETPGRKARFESERCALTLTRAPGDRLEAVLDEDSCFLWSSHDRLPVVRAGGGGPGKTSFDWAKGGAPG